MNSPAAETTVQTRQPSDAFPALTSEELEAVKRRGRTMPCQEGDVLFSVGDRPLDCVVVLQGTLEIIDVSGDEPRIIVEHGPGEFTGEIGTLTGRPAIAECRAKTDGEVVRLTSTEMRQLMIEVNSLGEKWVIAFLRRRELLETSGTFEGMRIFGEPSDPATLQLREFLHRNGVPHRWMDMSLDSVRENFREFCGDCALPLVAWGRAKMFENPSLSEIANLTCVHRPMPVEMVDTVIIGSGPAGLGAAVYAASEGLETLVLDRLGPGGQAGSSSRIENYAGFPEGISGGALALRSYVQALKFGALFSIPCTVDRITTDADGTHLITTTAGETARTRTVIISTGVSYRELTVQGLDTLRGSGVYYSATQVEAVLCQERPIHIIGAGNSAGQAAMFLSKFTPHVRLVVRGGSLKKSMSSYLSERVEANSRIQILLETELRGVHGTSCLDGVTLENTAEGRTYDDASSGIFIFIGAKPCTDFLGDRVRRDERGFVLTGSDVIDGWPVPGRQPLPLETSVPGIFAAGDCRSRTTKRVAFAVGDGALAVTCVHDLLGTYV